jgi:hypothetical protein
MSNAAHIAHLTEIDVTGIRVIWLFTNNTRGFARAPGVQVEDWAA